MSDWIFGEGGWEWSLVEEALDAEGLWQMEEYTQRRKATIAEYTTNIPIYKFFTEAERVIGSIMFMQ